MVRGRNAAGSAAIQPWKESSQGSGFRFRVKFLPNTLTAALDQARVQNPDSR